MKVVDAMAQAADDKAKLLRSLAIDRTPATAAQRRRWPALLAGGVAVAAVLVVAAQFVPALWPDRLADHSASQPSALPPAPPAGTEPRRAGTLAASGYVVARRKATVAAEITGKVI